MLSSLCPQRDRARPARRGRAVRDRHVSAGAADDRGRPRRLDRGDADDADGVLRRPSASARSSMDRSPTWSGASRRSISGSRCSSLGSIGCALAPAIEWLIAFRFVQGIGAASVMVIPRAIIRDLHTGVEATRLMSLVMLVFSVSPILAPLTGSALIVPFGWRAVFVAVTDRRAARAGADGARACRRRGRRRPSASTASLGSVLAGYRPAPPRPPLPRPDLHRRPRHVELLRLPGELVLRLHRPFRPDADAVQPRLLGQRGRLHRRLAVRRHARRALRHGAGSSYGAVTVYAALAVAALRSSTLAGVDSLPVLMAHAVLRLRLPRPRHPVDHGAGARGARPDRRHGLGARRHAADGHRRQR